MTTLYCNVISVNPTTGEQSCFKEIAGLSTETKPTDGLVDGSAFLEVDTGLVALFDSDNSEWHGGTVVDEGGGT